MWVSKYAKSNEVYFDWNKEISAEKQFIPMHKKMKVNWRISYHVKR